MFRVPLLSGWAAVGSKGVCSTSLTSRFSLSCSILEPSVVSHEYAIQTKSIMSHGALCWLEGSSLFTRTSISELAVKLQPSLLL